MSELALEFHVRAEPAHAFATWTERFGSWWPRAKTVSGAPASVRMEPQVGGRIVETDADGTEHVWGTVTRWEPPHTVGFRWHLFFDPAEATDVLITFTTADGGTRIMLEQDGFARLGAAGDQRRQDTGGAWTFLFGEYAAVAEGRTHEGDDR